MSRVLIFTNLKRWTGIDYGELSPVKTEWRGLIPNSTNSVVECVLREDASAQLRLVEDCSIHDGIYLLYDKMDKSLFDKLMEQCPEEDTFILVHTSGDWTMDKIPSRLLPNCKEGLHENTDDHWLYRPIYLTLADNQGDKMQRVLKVLEADPKAIWDAAAQTFMSGCMYPYFDSPDFLAAKDRLIAYPATSELVRKFYEDIYPNVTKRGEEPPRTRENYSVELKEFCNALVAVFYP